MNKIRLLVIGAGGHGRSVAEAAKLSGIYIVVGFLDDSLLTSDTVMGLPILGSVAGFNNKLHDFDQIIVAIGNNAIREKIMKQLASQGVTFATIIHPQAYVSPSAEVGKGSALLAGAIVGSEAILGMGVILNCGAVLDHDTIIGDFGHVGVNASMVGTSVLGPGSWMQAGSVLSFGARTRPGETLLPGQVVSSC